jgi:hypothetical protein
LHLLNSLRRGAAATGFLPGTASQSQRQGKRCEFGNCWSVLHKGVVRFRFYLVVS